MFRFLHLGFGKGKGTEANLPGPLNPFHKAGALEELTATLFPPQQVTFPRNDLISCTERDSAWAKRMLYRVVQSCLQVLSFSPVPEK